MRITFVAIGWEQLSIGLLSALAQREGHEVGLAFSVALFNDRYNLSLPALAPFFDDQKGVLETIRKQRPDVLVFSPLTGTYQWMLSIAEEAKKLLPDVQVLFGGVHASAVPERVMNQPQVDYVCVGEGDVAFPLILKDIERGSPPCPIPNTRFRLPDGRIIKGEQAGFIQDLDSLPFFDKTLWENHMNLGDLYFTMASRGCPYRCTFCFNSFYAHLPREGHAGKYVRQRGVEHMMSELRLAKQRYKLRVIEFEDDVFTVNKKWLKEFLAQYKKEINVPFQCLTHPQYMDDETARWLADAGCRYIQMGIQTMDDEFKHQTIKRYENSDQVHRALEAMKKHKIHAKLDHMFGLPGEPEAAQEAARQLYIQYPPYRIQTFWTNYLPGTELTRQAREKGLLSVQELDRLNDGLDCDFYRSSSKVQDPRKRKIYKAYEVIFKLIPILPKAALNRLNPEFFAALPTPLCAFISFFSDALIGLIKRNPDHLTYAKHQLHHLTRFFLRKMGLPCRPATTIRARRPFPATRSQGIFGRDHTRGH